MFTNLLMHSCICIDNIDQVTFNPLVGVLIAIVTVLVLIAIIIVIVMRMQASSFDNDSDGNVQKANTALVLPISVSHHMSCNALGQCSSCMYMVVRTAFFVTLPVRARPFVLCKSIVRNALRNIYAFVSVCKAVFVPFRYGKRYLALKTKNKHRIQTGRVLHISQLGRCYEFLVFNVTREHTRTMLEL